MPAHRLVSNTIGIGQLINEKRHFKVPDHQRDYAWSIGEVEQYLEDLNNAMRENLEDYFLGLIVLVEPEDGKTWYILDGQQRLATTTMVYSAIRNWLQTNGFDKQANTIHNDYIAKLALRENEHEPRIVLNVNNREIFQEVVINPCDDAYLETKKKVAGRHTSNRKLIEAVTACKSYVAKIVESQCEMQDKRADVLYKLAEYIRDNVQVNCMAVPTTENAYVIFESLNNRGVDLSVLDLVKNYIFGQCGRNLEDVKNNWTKMLTFIGDRKADDFLKTFWSSRYGRIQRGKLFGELKRKYSNYTSVTELSSDLSEDAELYDALEISDSDIWREHSETSKKYIKTLSILGGLQTHPVILAALKKFDRNKMEKLLGRLVTLIVRYQLVGRGRTGRLEIKCTSIAPKIFNGQLKTPKTVWDELLEIIPSDDDFRNDFINYSETKSDRARYILTELEIVKREPGRTTELTPTPDPEILNLEHVLPKNPSQAWKDVLSDDKDILKDCKYRLGNLCLLDKSVNRQGAAAGFKTKVKTYISSELILTNTISNYSKWNRESINNRQREMAELAIKAWPINPS